MANQSQMQYRRLGNTGVKVSVLSFGSWVTFNTQLDTDLALECMQAAHDAGCNFFDNAEAYAGGKSEEIMGKALAQLGWPRWSYMVTTKFFWGIHDEPVNMTQHAQPQVPVAGDRRLARAVRARLRRRRLLPPRRPRHPDRRDGVGDERHGVAGQGALLGHERVDGRRDPARDRHRRSAPPPQAGDRAVGVQPAQPRQGRGRVRPAVRRHAATATRSGARSPPAC